MTREPSEGASNDGSNPISAPVTPERIEALERAVAELAREVAAMRRPAAPPSHAAPRPRTELPLPSISNRVLAGRWSPANVEALVGRYGILALATICVLAMVGTFLGWAIRHGYLQLGPEIRISLGLLLALAVGLYGIRLRRRERSFGDTLLGLALAITHVCAWAAGPSLGIVSESVALALATLTSAALAVLAHHEADEPLWCVGFGGAALAPFVTSRDAGSALLLVTYGVAVLAAGGYALRGRGWRVAGRVQSFVVLLYVLTLSSMTDRSGGPLLSLALVAGVAVVVVAVGARERRRSWLRGCGILGVLVALRVATARDLPFDGLPFVLGTFLAWLLALHTTHRDPAGEIVRGLIVRAGPATEWLDGAWVPLGLLAASLIALPDERGQYRHAAIAGGAAALILNLASRLDRRTLRDALALAFSAASLLVAYYLSFGRPIVPSMAIVAAACLVMFAINRRWPSPSWLIVGVIALTLATGMSFRELEARSAFGYTPFFTPASALALWITGVWLFGAVMSKRALDERATVLQEENDVVVSTGMFLIAGVFAYLWILQELWRAVNPTVATLLVVAYFAATSVAAVGVGRARDIASLRHVGLVLALLAAGKALQGARNIGVGARILAYLVAAVFLLSIAYWYRRRDDSVINGG